MSNDVRDIENLNVHIGEVKMGTGDQILHTLLGSCVGIGLLWHEKKRYALAHCLLPTANYQLTSKIGAHFVDQAIHSLPRILDITPRYFGDLQAIVAGGGNMTKPDDTDTNQLVGHLNAELAIELLTKIKISIIHRDTGGLQGRKLTIDCRTGHYKIKQIPRNSIG